MKISLAVSLLAGCIASSSVGAFTTAPSSVYQPSSSLLKASEVVAADTTTTSSNSRYPDIDSTFGVSVEAAGKCPPAGKFFLELENSPPLLWWQNAELKHGRVAMFATVGYTIQKCGYYFGPIIKAKALDPWMLSTSSGITFQSISQAATPEEAFNSIPVDGQLQILLFSGIFEIFFYKYTENKDVVAGEYGWDPLNFSKEGGFKSPKMTEMRLAELKHGRMAMMAIAGWYANDCIPGALPFWHP